MLNTLLVAKDKMGQLFVEGTRVPVTYVSIAQNVVTQIKTDEKDGYWAVQLGFGNRRTKNVTKPVQGHLRGVIDKDQAPLFLREVRLKGKPDFKVGDRIKVSDIFKKGDVIAVTGTSKAKGFQGVVKRWGFAGGPKTHGQSDRLRAPGSIGQGTTPGRVLKGKHMAGRMGGETKTVTNLIVVDFSEDGQKMAVSGPIPGNRGGLITLRRIKAGSLKELVEETPQVVVHEEKEEKKEEPASSPESKSVQNKDSTESTQ